MTDVLIYADTFRCPELRHEVPLGVPDPFLYVEKDGVRHIVVGSMEMPRIREAGDYVLQKLSAVVRAKVRREDVFCRYGGEEFALVLPEVNLKGAVVTGEKLRKLIEKTEFCFENKPIPVTVSVGVSTVTKDLETMDILVAQADEKLFAAKRAGRNQVAS